MKKTILVAVILSVLLLISIVQAFQLNSLKKEIKEGQFILSSSGDILAVSPGSSRTDVLPSSIKNLPAMVGGC